MGTLRQDRHPNTKMPRLSAIKKALARIEKKRLAKLAKHKAKHTTHKEDIDV